MYNSNFRYSQDPFNIFKVNDSDRFGGFKPPKKKSYLGEIILVVVGIFLIAIVFLFRDVIWEIFFPKKKETDDTKKDEGLSQKRLNQNIIKRFDLSVEASWDLEYLDSKIKEGKADFIKNQGWVFYE
jgi:hypothetical protein